MTKTIKTCDECGKMVEWLYQPYQILVEGLKLNIYETNHFELCKECMEKRCAAWNKKP